jgi:4-hydroxy-tetrahydrodipicolinate synthase
MMGLILEGNIESAATEHKRLLPIFKALFGVTNPIPIKYAVNRVGFNAGSVRLPLCDPDDDFISTFNPVMDEYEADLPVS